MSDAATSNSSLWALDQLRIQLQRAATMCQPSAAVRAVATEESFDSADMEDVDSDEGVGVDERAAELRPEDFLQEDDEDWYSSARWVLNRQETRDFIAASLLSHLAPLYVPYAAIDARTPDEIVPEDVRKDIETFTDDFVLDSNLYSMSVQDVKDGVGAALGGSGLMFIPHEMPVYDESTFEEPEDNTSALGVFGDKFEDTDDGWNTWYSIFQADNSVADQDTDDEDDEDEDEDEDRAAAASDAMSGLVAGSAVGRDDNAGAKPHEEQAEEEDEDDSDLAAAGSTQTERKVIEQSAAKEAARGRNARALLREVIIAVLVDKVGLGGLPLTSERAMAALEQRLSAGKNARNGLMLLKRTTCHPLAPGDNLKFGAATQAGLLMLLSGPLRSIRIESEDLPRAAVKAAEAFAARFIKSRTTPTTTTSGVVESGRAVGEEMLSAARGDAELSRRVSGWCLKFLFEGEAMEDEERRAAAFVQCAVESVHGPFAGIAVRESADGGLVWAWEDVAGEGDGALTEFAAGYGREFELMTGSSLASVLDLFRRTLTDAGFKLASWCLESDTAATSEDPAVATQTDEVAVATDKTSCDGPPSSQNAEAGDVSRDAAPGDEAVPALGALPTPPVSGNLPPGFKFDPPPLPPGLDSTPLPVPPVAPPADARAPRTEC